jgi:hypothetical protein
MYDMNRYNEHLVDRVLVHVIEAESMLAHIDRSRTIRLIEREIGNSAEGPATRNMVELEKEDIKYAVRLVDSAAKAIAPRVVARLRALAEKDNNGMTILNGIDDTL